MNYFMLYNLVKSAVNDLSKHSSRPWSFFSFKVELFWSFCSV